MKSPISILSLSLITLFGCSSNPKKSSEAGLIFKDSLGHAITATDLSNATGEINYEVMSNQSINPEAQQLHNDARQLGQSAKYDAAIAKLEQAMKIQPSWPYPPYDLAYTYLLKGDFDNSLKYYQITDKLSPKGFFTTKTALYTLEGEKAGRFPKGMYAAYMQIEWVDDENKKLEIAQALTQKVPDFAPAWKELALLLDKPSEKLETIDKGLSLNPDADTKGILLINKAAVLNEMGKLEEAKKILGDLIFSADVTTGNLQLAKFTLKNITEEI